jgi:hypothetical protein
MGHPFLDEKEVIRREFYSKKGIVKKYFSVIIAMNK